MPFAPPRACTRGGHLVIGRGPCPVCTKARDKARGSAASRGYDTRWQAARARFLAAHRWCEECTRAGRRVLATVVDHRTPHRGNQALFWNEGNWSALCATHHNRKTATRDGGFGR
jgi:5-methylcytosine-specific restriction protein A